MFWTKNPGTFLTMIFREDDIESFTNRYDLILLQPNNFSSTSNLANSTLGADIKQQIMLITERNQEEVALIISSLALVITI